jgi:hypothetical protein
MEQKNSFWKNLYPGKRVAAPEEIPRLGKKKIGSHVRNRRLRRDDEL